MCIRDRQVSIQKLEICSDTGNVGKVNQTANPIIQFFCRKYNDLVYLVFKYLLNIVFNTLLPGNAQNIAF